jgi:nicotinate-nucleotide adenylyltransferase
MNILFGDLLEIYSFMPIKDQRLKNTLMNENKIIKTPEEVVYFGGSFNPFHQGHKACIELLPADKFLLICPDRNPQKDRVVSENDLQILYQTLKSELTRDFHFYPGFWLQDKKNPTIDWISSVADIQPQLKNSLLIGFDSLRNFHTWVRAKDLASKLHCLYVVSRLETDQEKNDVIEMLKLAGIEVKIVFLGHHDYEDISSSEMRKKKGA